ncbi:hypothetical protein L2E82_36951 [Cichorium intybus]|uniref:Uncharacterized protein n=1 Tax=Cichorium intybus TaxID=13427 RepID=A0ACB9AF32_CICIN|nr:hypothetical protein L2E82_36951 [Cichorium intybus]
MSVTRSNKSGPISIVLRDRQFTFRQFVKHMGEEIASHNLLSEKSNGTCHHKLHGIPFKETVGTKYLISDYYPDRFILIPFASFTYFHK